MSNESDPRQDRVVSGALSRLEDDLDDLRDRLAQELDTYEGRISKASNGMPIWLKIDPAWIREWFQFEFDEMRLVLGPRVVAFGASRVETLFRTNFVGKSPDDSFAEELEEVGEFLQKLSERTRIGAEEAQEQLADILDEVLLDIEEKREKDEHALQQLVSSGDVERGEETQKEIADLWEEQRARAKEAKAAWETLERLVFEGLEHVGEGLEELEEFLDLMRGLVFGVKPKEKVVVPDESSRKTEKLPTEGTSEWERESAETWGPTDPDVGPTAPMDSVKEFDDEPVEEESESEPVEVEEEAVEEEVVEEEPVEEKLEEAPKEVSVRGVASRVVDEWAPISALEFLVVAGPFFVFSIVFGTMLQMGGTPVWFRPWVFPVGFGTVATWLVLGAIVRHWRMTWPPAILSLSEEAEETDYEIRASKLFIDGKEIKLEAKIEKWRSEQSFGWAVSSSGICVFCEGRNFKHWDNYDAPMTAIRPDAWEIPGGLEPKNLSEVSK
ncbi:hypothetical protein FRD01_07205 [Microvenator marinus]|uniref:Uncharacterized protein n=1 Tax=Microvenator marinus TaxID=2600177 RepID=A0A5B8XN32_9DELT|nr:hypothetical protein [Microvenator marinus]QED27030.1 hypothetical protein FRD01_07205 [Microvenator marinus]